MQQRNFTKCKGEGGSRRKERRGHRGETKRTFCKNIAIKENVGIITSGHRRSCTCICVRGMKGRRVEKKLNHCHMSSAQSSPPTIIAKRKSEPSGLGAALRKVPLLGDKLDMNWREVLLSPSLDFTLFTMNSFFFPLPSPFQLDR